MGDAFDVIIVGTGMGAGAAGYELAKSGLKVLFVEKGLAPEKLDPKFAGNYAEHFVHKHKLDREHVFQRSSRSTYRVNGSIPVLGGGLGGSTAVYGAGLLRFFPRDFRNWPLRYEDLKPYYDRCDRLFTPLGDSDPLEPDKRPIEPRSLPLPQCQAELAAYLKSQGLHPYRLPVAIDERATCEKCVGYFCPADCKRTSGNVFVLPATTDYGARILYEAEVESLEMDGDRCIGVNCRLDSGRKVLKADYIFLGAGALVTPVILMNSKANRFPDGVGNTNGVLGRYLMRHLIDFFYVRTAACAGIDNKIMELGVSDFYESRGWAILQSGGQLMPAQLIAKEFAVRSLPSSPNFVKALLSFIVRCVLAPVISNRLLVVAIMEDEPVPANRVLPSSTVRNIRIEYSISEKDRLRVDRFRAASKQLFRPLNVKLLRVAEDNSFLAHSCGTCRMGLNPENSVVDPAGRVRGTRNVYVVDASTFPSSSAVNPSLTVAAVAMKIAQEFVLEMTGKIQRRM